MKLFHLRFTAYGFMVAVAVLLSIAWTTYVNVNDAIENNSLTKKSYQEIMKTDEILYLLKDAETGVESYLKTKISRYLKPYQDSKAQIIKVATELHGLSNQPIQQMRLMLLEEYIGKRIKILDISVSSMKSKGYDDLNQFMLSRSGKIAMDDVERIVKDMKQEEMQTLEKRSLLERSSVKETVKFVVIGNIASFILLFAIFAMLNVQINERKKAQDALAVANKQLEYQINGLQETNDGIHQLLLELDQKNTHLEEMDKLKSDLIAEVSHELRTPLASVKHSIDLVVDGMFGKMVDKQKDFLGIAQRNVDRLNRMVTNVLDMQKIEAGKLELHLSEGHIKDAVMEVKTTMEALAKSKGLDILTEFDKESYKLSFDRDRIIQVLINLCNNSLKFTKEGYLKLAVVSDEKEIKVSVQDTGPGIRQEDLSKLFQKFSQVGDGGAAQYKGTGLGLAISKQIVEMHKGRIWAESQFGKGTTFSFTLPAA